MKSRMKVEAEAKARIEAENRAKERE